MVCLIFLLLTDPYSEAPRTAKCGGMEYRRKGDTQLVHFTGIQESLW